MIVAMILASMLLIALLHLQGAKAEAHYYRIACSIWQGMAADMAETRRPAILVVNAPEAVPFVCKEGSTFSRN